MSALPDSMAKPFKLGCDVGNVLCFDDSEPSENTIDSMAELVAHLGPPNLLILSKAKRNQQKKTLDGFERVDFYTRTGVLPRNVIFVQDRIGSKEQPLRLSQMQHVENSPVLGPVYAPRGYGKGVVGLLYGLQGLIDDKSECLIDLAYYAEDPSPLLLHFCPNHRDQKSPDKFTRCQSWSDVLSAVENRTHLLREAATYKARLCRHAITASTAASSSSSMPLSKKMPRRKIVDDESIIDPPSTPAKRCRR